MASEHRGWNRRPAGRSIRLGRAPSPSAGTGGTGRPGSGGRSWAAAQRAILEALFMQALVGAVAELRGVDIEEFVFDNADTKVAP